MRTVYLGTSEFAAAVLHTLARSSHRPQLVITRPDRPKGRGRKLSAPPVAQAARELGLTLAQPASVNTEEAHQEITAAEPGALVVCAFGALIKEPLLSDFEILNVHPSLLPRWRGAAPVERAIMAGDDRTGVSIMRLTAGLDSGPVALAQSTEITPQDTYGSLATRLEAISSRLLVRALDAGSALVFTEQDEAAGVTYAEKITAEDRRLDPAQPAEVLARQVRALSPHIGAFVQDTERLGVWEAHARPAQAGDPAPGTLSLDGAEPLLGCGGDSTLVLTMVQPAGKRAMGGTAFLRGRR